MILKFKNGGIIKLQNGPTISEDEQFDSLHPAHKIDLSKARRKEIRNFARNLAGMDNPEYGATAKDYQEGFVDLGLNKRKSKFFDRVFRDQLAKNLEHTDRVNRDQQVIQAVKEGNFDPGQFREWLALKRDESPITQKFVMPLVTGAAFGPAMTVASLAGEAANLGTNAITGWDTWGKALASGRKDWSGAAELTNPGYIVTGPLANGGQRLIQGWKTVTNSTKDLQNQALNKIAKEFYKSIKHTPIQGKMYNSIPEKVEYSYPIKIGSSKFSDYNRDVDKEMAFKMHEDYEFGKWDPNKLNGWGVKNHLDKTKSQIYRNKYNFLDRTYDGRYAVDPEEGFIRRNQGGTERAEFIRKHPVNDLNTTSAGKTSIEEQINLAERNFAKKYQNDFKTNFNKAVRYDALAGTELGYSEGTILGPFVEHFGITPGQIKFKHTSGDISPLARIVESHEAHHATGNMDDSFVLRYLIERGIIDESKLSNYLKDADRGEVTAHLSELPDWLGFTGRIKGKYTGHPFRKTEITASDIYNYNKFNHQNGFKHTIWDAINQNKIHEFVKFMNEHPFSWTLPTVGTAGITLKKQNPQQ